MYVIVYVDDFGIDVKFLTSAFSPSFSYSFDDAVHFNEYRVAYDICSSLREHGLSCSILSLIGLN